MDMAMIRVRIAINILFKRYMDKSDASPEEIKEVIKASHQIFGRSGEVSMCKRFSR